MLDFITFDLIYMAVGIFGIFTAIVALIFYTYLILKGN